ncbi:MAG: alpha/beta hydrolase [Chitinophagales bacterium]|nr:alpha/beta hydrolase [Chitinophagales bacterium]
MIDNKGYAPVNGLKMYYEVHEPSGKAITEGIPLVLIHGGGSTIETTFANILPLLAQYVKTIAIELQAHGRTDDRDGDSSFEQDADDVAGLLTFLKISKADFLGFSNGGNTAMQIAIRQPELVNKLIIASSFYKRDGLIPGFFEGLQQATLDNMPEPLKTGYLKVADNKEHLQVMFDRDRKRMLQFTDWTDEDLRLIKAKTFLILGDRDVVRSEHAVEMFRLLPNAALVILPGEHGACIGEVTTAKEGSKIVELTALLIKEFLAEPG